MAARKKGNGGTRRTGSSRGKGASRGTGRTGKTTRSRSSAKKTTYRQSVKHDAAFFELQNEIILMIALVVALLLLLSNFHLGGKVGSAVNGFMFGVFGLLNYIFPVILFCVTAFYLANRGNHALIGKLLCMFGMLVMTVSLLQLLTSYSPEQLGVSEGAQYTFALKDYFRLAKQYKKGGGILGGFVCYLFEPLFGKAGSFVIVIALLLIFFMLFSKKAIFAWIAKKGSERYAEHKVHADERREYYEQRQAERERIIEEKRKEMGERRAKTFLLSEKERDALKDPKERKEKESEPKKEEETRNFFGGKTPTGKYVYGGNEYTLPKETIKEVDSLYKEDQKSLRKKEKREAKEADRAQDTKERELEVLKISPTTGEYINTANAEKEAVENTGAGVDADVKKQAESTKEEKQQAQKTSAASEGEEPLVIEEAEPVKKYEFPPIDLLTKPKAAKQVSESDLRETARKLQSTLDSFGVRVNVTNVSCGPSVTRYELMPEQGVKVSKITSLADDIKLNLAAADIRIEAPIPGKAAVGIEVPNQENSTVFLRELLESKEFVSHASKLSFAVGKDIGGQTVVTDIAKMPHLLIAGATGSGKSVCINTLIMSILYKADPKDVKLIMVDPKVVELSVYNGIPHLLIPVVTDPKKASAALNWAVVEMTDRYNKFAELGVRDLKGYNERVDEAAAKGLEEEKYKRLPQIVIIVDELADLMMVAPGEVEDSICRLAQLARAAGLHLVIATQRPSVNVITGLIKANIPSRIAFAVSSAIDSRTILDGAGAEKLLGKGDMLFFPSGYNKPVRVQGAFVSDHEVSAVVEFLKTQCDETAVSHEIMKQISSMPSAAENGADTGSSDGRDEYFAEAGRLIIEKDKASIGMLQRAYKVGFNRAARIMDQLADAGVVSPEQGTKARQVLMSAEEFERFLSGGQSTGE